jgi:formimidoylglutamate deiminase
MIFFKFKALRLKNKWLSPAFVGVDEKGILQYLSDKTPHISLQEHFKNHFLVEKGIALPAFINAHSHAFQYAMVGRAETHKNHVAGDFWTWREAMYRTALAVSPTQLEHIATYLYAQMRKLGYAQVVEFHYLHHAQAENIQKYENETLLGEILIKSAQKVGLGITLVPIFYQKGNFGTTFYPEQRRFIHHSLEEYISFFKKYEILFNKLGENKEENKNNKNSNKNIKLGAGFHSLRAVEPDILKDFHDNFIKKNEIPLHLHLAEQKKEVQDCINYLEKRPAEWLLENIPLSERYNLVHCTHLTPQEAEGLAKSGANVVFCPSTEGNLGDGIFDWQNFILNNGNWTIGTDSHIGINPSEELRLVDYAQRLKTHNRMTFASAEFPESADYAMQKSVFCGWKSAGFYDKNDFFELEKPFNAFILDEDEPFFQDLDNVLNAWLYNANCTTYTHTIIGANVGFSQEDFLQWKRDFAKTIGEIF